MGKGSLAARRGNRMNRGCISSGSQTADAQIHTGAGVLSAIIVIPDGTNEALIEAYDGTDNTGTKLAAVKVAGDGLMGGHENIDVEYSTGLFIDVTLSAGTVEYIAYFQKDS